MYELIPFAERDKDWFEKQVQKNLYSSQPWMDLLLQSYDFECFLLINDKNKLVSAFCNREDMMGKRLISLPFSDYLPYQEGDDFSAIIAACQSHFPGHQIILKTNLPAVEKDHFTIQKKAVYHTIDISSSSRPKQSKSFKRGVKQAEKNGISVRFKHSLRALEDFYALYHRLRFDKFNIIPQPFSFFKNLWEQMICREQGVILEAVLEEKLIASMIVLTCDNTAYYKYGCSALEHLDLKPNNILFQKLIDHYTSLDFDHIDLGLSGIGSTYAGLRRWKSSMGGTEKPLTYWSHLPVPASQDLELLEKNKRKVQEITRAIVAADLDASQTSRLSEKIYPLLA